MSPKPPRSSRDTLNGVIGLIVICFLIYLFVPDPSLTSNQKLAPPSSYTPPKDIAEAERRVAQSPLSAREIAQLEDTATEAQIGALSDKHKGRTLALFGYVEDVQPHTFGDGYDVLIDLHRPTVDLSIQEIMFDTEKATALRLNLHEKVYFEGQIKSILSVLGTAQITLANTYVTPISALPVITFEQRWQDTITKTQANPARINLLLKTSGDTLIQSLNDAYYKADALIPERCQSKYRDPDTGRIRPHKKVENMQCQVDLMRSELTPYMLFPNAWEQYFTGLLAVAEKHQKNEMSEAAWASALQTVLEKTNAERNRHFQLFLALKASR